MLNGGNLDLGVGEIRPFFKSVKGILFLLSGISMMINLYLIFMWVPTEAVLGHVQRIMYVHVPMAWISFLAFFVVLIGSIGYLSTRKSNWDLLAVSAAEIGVIFTSLVLITGPIWAKPVWGVWWTWDPRLITTLVLWLTYASYLMLRSYSFNSTQGAIFSSVLGIIGFVNVPIVYFAVDLWRTQHQRLVIGGSSLEGNLHQDMWVTLLFSLWAFTLLFSFLLWDKIALRKVEDDITEVEYLVNRDIEWRDQL